MTDLFSLLDDNAPDDASPAVPSMMSDSQRSEIRELFGCLGVAGAREQFELVYELTAQRIASVAELDFDTAQTLIRRLRNRVQNLGRANSGNAWDDRPDDTWIDKL